MKSVRNGINKYWMQTPAPIIPKLAISFWTLSSLKECIGKKISPTPRLGVQKKCTSPIEANCITQL